MNTQLTALAPKLLAEARVPKSGRVIGIDLGTTNSAVAGISMAPGTGLPEVRCCPIVQHTELTSYTSVLVPSIVALEGDVPLIGEGAKRLRAKAAERGLKQNRNIFWECKNDMGVRRTYHLAPEGYRSAHEIAAHLLGFIKEAADRASPVPTLRTVVTVPASFQTAQRTDTIKAAKLAGIALKNGDLLDEPIAAFLDYVITYPERLSDRLKAKTHLVVFDFGGGTCDVAIFDLEPNDTGIDIASRAVSRFHRLGGGDIDRAIVHEVLVPQLCKENGLGPHDLDYETKRLFLEPALLNVAESLKLQLCRKITELKAFTHWDQAAAKATLAQLAIPISVAVADRNYSLSAPRLSATEFGKVLEPFVDRDLLCARETEYCLTNSVFTPLQDALDRARLDRSVISLVLMVGGSSLIPQVQEAVRAFFSEATFLAYDDVDRVQTTVARGAAFHAYTMELFGKPLFRPVAHDSICIRSVIGFHELVQKGETLAADGADVWRIFDGLAIARTNLVHETPLRVELIAGNEGRLLYSELWHIPAPVNAGEKLRLEYRFTQNQVFEFRLSLLEEPETQFTGEVENPLTHVVNPQSVRIEIEEIEEQIREGAIPRHSIPDKVVELAQKYAALGQNEKAISLLGKALRERNHADSYILNLLGIYCGNVGDSTRQEKFYREAARSGGGTAPLFNLALAQKNRHEYQAAMKTIEEMEQRQIDGPGLTLRVNVMDALKTAEGRESTLDKALSLYPPLTAQTDWEFDWYRTAATLKGDTRLNEAIAVEKQRRLRAGEALPPQGELPTVGRSLAAPR